MWPDSKTAQAKVPIKKRLAPLIRLNSRFWTAGGINITLALTRAEISAQSVQTLISGGVAFATPDNPAKEVL